MPSTDQAEGDLNNAKRQQCPYGDLGNPFSFLETAGFVIQPSSVCPHFTLATIRLWVYVDLALD